MWSPPPTDQSYFTLIGSLPSMPFASEPRRVPFENSGMGRDLLIASWPGLVVATSHLESLNMVRKRRKQIDTSLPQIEAAGRDGTLVFCGDTNLNEAIDGEVAPPAPWIDAWSALRPSEPGATFDATVNRMVHRLDGWARTNKAQLRFDRFWVRPGALKPTAIELIATEPLADEPGSAAEPVWPSDHFGLLLTLCGDEGPASAPKASADKKCTVM